MGLHELAQARLKRLFLVERLADQNKMAAALLPDPGLRQTEEKVLSFPRSETADDAGERFLRGQSKLAPPAALPGGLITVQRNAIADGRDAGGGQAFAQ